MTPKWMAAAIPQRPVDRAAALAKSGRADAATGPLRALHLNESPYPPSPAAIEAARAWATAMNRYPDSMSRALVGELSSRTGIAPSRIVCGHGSEELILAICTLAGGPGGEVIVPTPSFPVIGVTASQRGSAVVRVPLDAGGACDADAMVAAVTPRTRVVFCCTPNPPSGGAMSAQAVARVIDGVPHDALLVMDEAYHEFARHAGAPDILAALARRTAPWIVLRTFSKAYGLTGARVGYAICSSDGIADALRAVKTLYGPSGGSLASALAALKDDAYLASTLDAVARERARMIEGLSALGLQPLPSAANFVSVALPMPAADAMVALHERGILVRDWRDPAFTRELRITVGRPEDTTAFLDAIAAIVATAHASREAPLPSDA